MLHFNCLRLTNSRTTQEGAGVNGMGRIGDEREHKEVTKETKKAILLSLPSLMDTFNVASSLRDVQGLSVKWILFFSIMGSVKVGL